MLAAYADGHTMRPVTDLIGFDEAYRRTRDAFAPLDRSEPVDLGEAVDRVLAETVVAQTDLPTAARSARDGYALRAADLADAGATLRLIGSVDAGDPPDAVTVSEGTCVQIATGALIPRGADAVVMVERTQREGDEVRFEAPAELGRHVVPPGSDVARGRTVLDRGDSLTPFRVAVAAALGRRRLQVLARPRVVVTASGSEVKPLTADLGPGHVYDSNSEGLAPILSRAGADVERADVIEDTYDGWRRFLEVSQPVDAIVVTGGSSAGEKDLAARVLADVGTVHFHGVRVKPGKPMLVATVDDVPVVVLPGFPASCLLDAIVFVAPAVRRMAGRPEPPPAIVPARMGHAERSPRDKHHLLPVRLDDDVAHSTFRDSGATTSLADAVGYVEIPEGVDAVEQGAAVDVRVF